MATDKIVGYSVVGVPIYESDFAPSIDSSLVSAGRVERLVRRSASSAITGGRKYQRAIPAPTKEEPD